MVSVIRLVLLWILALPAYAQLSEAQVNYMLQCQGCHKADGTGKGEDVPSFRTYMNQYLQVEGGRKYLVQVPGSANAPLSASQLADVLNWIITTMPGAQSPHDFQPFTAKEVLAYSTKKLVGVDEERLRLIKLITDIPKE